MKKSIILNLLVTLIFAGNLFAQNDKTSVVRPDNNTMDCIFSIGENAIYIKGFPVVLKKSTQGLIRPSYFTVMLNRGTHYRFTICSEDENAILKLFDRSELIFSSFNERTGTDYRNVDFVCKKSYTYTGTVSSKNEDASKAIVILSIVRKQ